RAKLQRLAYAGLVIVAIAMGWFGWQLYQQRTALQAQRLAAEVERAAAAESLSQTSRTLLESGSAERAIQSAREALRLSTQLAKNKANDKDREREVAIGQLRLGDVLYAASKFDDAMVAYKASLAVQERIFHQNHPDIAQSLRRIVGLLTYQG